MVLVILSTDLRSMSGVSQCLDLHILLAKIEV